MEKLQLIHPTDAKSFDAMMTVVDQKFDAVERHLPGRELEAFLVVSYSLGINAEIRPNDQRKLEEVPYDKYGIWRHISNWYSSRYGDKMSIQTGVVPTVFLLHGALWRVSQPAVIGRCIVTVEDESDLPLPHVSRSGRVCLNMVTHVPKTVINYLRECGPSDLAAHLSTFTSHLNWAHLLMYHSGTFYFDAIRTDCRSAVEAMTRIDHNYAQAHWDCLQASEKAIKSLILADGGQHANTHKLKTLVSSLPARLQAAFSTVDIEVLQAHAGLRYEGERYTAQEAYSFYLAMRRVVGTVSQRVPFERPPLFLGSQAAVYLTNPLHP